MRKSTLGFFTRYSSGVRPFLEYAKGYSPWLNTIVQDMDFSEIEKRVLARIDPWDFRRAAGDTLSRVNADPRNHFGKYALRRFDT